MDIQDVFDIKLKCEDGIIHANKSFLKQKCKYFEILFSEKFNDNKEETILFEDVSYKSLKETIEYINKDKINFKTLDEVIDCLFFAMRIDFTKLEISILNYMNITKLIVNKDTIMDNIKRLLDIKYMNEEIITKKIIELLNEDKINKTIPIQNDEDIEIELNKMNLSSDEPCKLIYEKNYKNDKVIEYLKQNKLYLFADYNEIEWYVTQCEYCFKSRNKKLHKGCCYKYTANDGIKRKYRNKLYTEKMLYTRYHDLKKFDANYIFGEIFEIKNLYLLNQEKLINDIIKIARE
jgi:hypothetical protein